MSSANSRSARAIALWAPVLAYTGLIFWLSSAPRPIPGALRFPWIDKPIHMTEYALLGILSIRAFWNISKRIPTFSKKSSTKIRIKKEPSSFLARQQPRWPRPTEN